MRRAAAWATWGVGLVACPGAWVPLGLANGEGWTHAIVTTLVIPVLPTVGLVITLRQRDNPIGRLLLVVGTILALGSALTQLVTWLDARGTGDVAIGWVAVANNAAFLGLALVPLIVLRFPDGQPPTERWRSVLRIGEAGVVLAAVASVFAPEEFEVTPTRTVPNPAWVAALGALWNVVGVVAFAAIAGTAVAAAASMIVRWRRSRDQERAQLKWVAWSASTGLLLVLAIQLTGIGGSAGVVVASIALLVAFPVSILIAILEYRLYDIDVLVDRTIVYVALSALLTALYLGIVSLISTVFGATSDTTAGIVAAGLVALAFAPSRNRLQLLVSRRLFGFRHEPEAAFDLLGGAIGRGDGATDVRASLAEAVAASLRLPYAALVDADGASVGFGEPIGPLHDVDLVYRGEVLGTLVVSGRSASEAVSARDGQVLEQLAVYLAVALHAAASADQLERSRSLLVRAREDERRRMRRDLHDGLGPALTALGFGLDATTNLVGAGAEPADVAEQVARLRCQVDDAIADVRRLVHDLRPPALDDLGLAGALAAQAAALQRDGLDISVRSDGELTHLPAAVEVTAFRIASEAMNNVARHARARTCQVLITIDGALNIEVTDDGIGIDEAASHGVGLRSMRERIDEVRGRLHITSATGLGTTVRATVPMDTA